VVLKVHNTIQRVLYSRKYHPGHLLLFQIPQHVPRFHKLEMAMLFENVVLSSLTERGEIKQNYSTPVRLEISEEKDNRQIKVINGKFVRLD